ncbi:MAG: hypothetical protein ACPIOQ_38590 [Promethearchaeia archaeon]
MPAPQWTHKAEPAPRLRPSAQAAGPRRKFPHTHSHYAGAHLPIISASSASTRRCAPLVPRAGDDALRLLIDASSSKLVV